MPQGRGLLCTHLLSQELEELRGGRRGDVHVLGEGLSQSDGHRQALLLLPDKIASCNIGIEERGWSDGVMGGVMGGGRGKEKYIQLDFLFDSTMSGSSGSKGKFRDSRSSLTTRGLL